MDDPTYGQLKLFNMSWSGNADLAYQEIPFRPCTDEELGLGPNGSDDPRSKFYSLAQSTIDYKQRLNCVDEKIIIYGAYESEDVNHI